MHVDVRMAIMGSSERAVKCRMDVHQLTPCLLKRYATNWFSFRQFSVASEIWGAGLEEIKLRWTQFGLLFD
jgi:hypothetical protein